MSDGFSERYLHLKETKQYKKLIDKIQRDFHDKELSNEAIYWLIRANYLDHNIQEANKLGLKYINKIDNPIWRARIYSTLGGVNLYLGDLVESEKYTRMAIDLLDDSYHLELAKLYNNLGIIFDLKGDYPKALELYTKSLKMKEALDPATNPDKITLIAGTKVNLGDIHRQLLEFEEAEKLFMEANEIFEANSARYNQILTSFFLFRIKLRQGKHAEVDIYRNRIHVLHKILDSEHSEVYYHLTNGIYLKNSHSILDKAQAIEELTLIVDNYDSPAEPIILAYLNLIELKIQEYRLSPVEQNLEDLHHLLSVTEERAYANFRYPIIIDLIILRARLNMIQKDFTSTYDKIKQAEDLINDKNLDLLSCNVEDFKDEFEAYLQRFKLQFRQHQNTMDEIEQLDILEYLNALQNHI